MTEKKLPTVTVDCAQWARGLKNGEPALKNGRGYLCCLGFATEQLVGKALSLSEGFCTMPTQFKEETGIPVPGLTESFEEISRAAGMANVNDDRDLSDAQRMRELRPLAKKAGFKFRFINKDKL